LKKLETVKVPPGVGEVRLSDYTPGIFKSITSKKGMKKAIEKGYVKVNGEVGRTADYIRGGEIIELFRGKIKERPVVKIDLEILYEDDYLAVVNKPAGIVVSGNKKHTLENALNHNLKISTQVDGLTEPEPIHRLDQPTSGAVLIGKTSNVVAELNKAFEDRSIDKTYYAVTIGKMKKKGEIDTEIKGKSAKTSFKVIATIESEKYQFLNLVEVNPETGRRHQIRIHLSEMGNPILGDNQYGKDGKILKGKGLYLHASGLSFVHPATGEKVDVKVALANKIQRLFPEVV
jgi:23S rRNA pseudouridine1911/1915/1917 synthase